MLKIKTEPVRLQKVFSNMSSYQKANTDFSVLDEKSDIITVNAADLKTEDELQFIAQMKSPNFLKSPSRSTQHIVCKQCLLSFSNKKYYITHLEGNWCSSFQQLKCICCPLEFQRLIDLEHHLKLHRMNRFFCSKNCGKYFSALEECLKHEIVRHNIRNMSCYICKNKFFCGDDLIRHLPTHNHLERSVCSYCHRWFLSTSELVEHWRDHARCGRLMNSVTITKLENLESAKRRITPQVEEQEEQKIKRFKVEMEQHLLYSNNEAATEEQETELVINEDFDFSVIEIKSEPLDDDDELQEADINNMCTVVTAQDIKTENEDLEDVSKCSQMPLLEPCPQLAFSHDSLKMPKLRLPSLKPSPAIAVKDDNEYIKLTQDKLNFGLNQKDFTNEILPLPIHQQKSHSPKLPHIDHNYTDINKCTTPPPISQCNNSSQTSNTTSAIDIHDLRQLIADISGKCSAEGGRKMIFSRCYINMIESLPEKRQVIDNMLVQIRQAENQTKIPIETLTPTVSTSQSLLKSAQVQTQENDLKFVEVPILTVFDSKIWFLLNQNPLYTYVYVCPYCAKEYQKKPELREHLIFHQLSKQQFEMLTVMAKPIPVVAKTEYQEPSPVVSPTWDDQSSSSSSSATKTPIKMSALNIRRKQRTSSEHNQTSSKKHTCPNCSRNYSSSGMLKDHIGADCSRNAQYQCKICMRKYFSKSTLTCHMTIHTGELPHKCNYCDKRFRTRGQVTVHHRTHTGEKPFSCQVCSQSFTHRETLISHLSRHIGMKRYKCYSCNKTFACISGLKTHRETRPDTCGQVKLNSRAVGPRVRVVKGEVIFEPQPEINPYLKTTDPEEILAEIQNQQPKKA